MIIIIILRLALSLLLSVLLLILLLMCSLFRSDDCLQSLETNRQSKAE